MAGRDMMQFDWRIPPDRLQVEGGMEAKPIGFGGYGVVGGTAVGLCMCS